MHLPDGYLSDPVCLATTVLSSASLAGCIVQLRSNWRPSRNQAMALASAAIFSAQMLNFPIGPATSGHVLGAACAAILLGPYAAALCMTVVVTLQCLLFADGGLQSLGANLLNMAVIAPLAASIVYRTLANSASSSSAKSFAAVAAGLASVVTAALACSIELAFSGIPSMSTILSPMLGWHALIGLTEGLLTVGVLYAVTVASRTGFITHRHRMTATAATLAMLICLAPFASAAPDALECVSLDYSFAGLAHGAWTGVAPEYAMPGISWEFLAVALAGTMGLTAVYLTAVLISRAVTCKVAKRPIDSRANHPRLGR